MSPFLLIKIAIVIYFLFMFWRRANWVWGIGLLTITTAVFFDTFWRIFGGDDLAAELGFFYNVIAGLIAGGAAVWLWGITRPLFGESAPVMATSAVMTTTVPLTAVNFANGTVSSDGSPHDRQMLFEQIRDNLSPDDVYDLIFDLELVENEVVAPTRDMIQTIVNIMEVAAARGQTNDLALAIERILTPVPPDHLPRLSKLSADSPPTVLRRYLLSFYFVDQLQTMAEQLGVDWERLGLGSKQSKIRNFLLYLKRRNRLPELIDLMQRPTHEEAS
ncbi:MAG: hypothetical protein KDE51_27475 [Anaerolineales bacterium]|nr:hypothetical protein [Anaerolineales bacterium]